MSADEVVWRFYVPWHKETPGIFIEYVIASVLEDWAKPSIFPSKEDGVIGVALFLVASHSSLIRLGNPYLRVGTGLATRGRPEHRRVPASRHGLTQRARIVPKYFAPGNHRLA